MVFSGLEQIGECPFHDVLIHGLIRDDQGRKFSKSLGNGIDPIDVIDKYGADALRLMLVTGNAPGNDMRFYWERLDDCRNFNNKLWNASRFVLMNLEDEKDDDRLLYLTSADKWILSKVNTLTKEVTDNLTSYELGLAAQKIRDFLWDEYCDWYIEMVKPRLYNKEDSTRDAALWTLKTVLINALKLLHPFMPFITEEIYSALVPEEESLMMSEWPKYREDWNFPADENVMDHVKAMIRGIRNIRSEMDVPNSRKTKVYIVSEDEKLCQAIDGFKESAQPLMLSTDIFICSSKEGAGDNAVSIVVPDAVVYLPLEDLVDFEQEMKRLTQEEERLNGEIRRAQGMLANEKFVSRAPEAKVQEERDKLEKYTQMLAQVKERMAGLRK